MRGEFYNHEVSMSMNTKITAKVIREQWEKYMQGQITKTIAPYDSTKHRILDSGSVIKLDSKYGKEVIEEVGLDYATFKMKFNTSDNPTWTDADRA